MRSAIKELEGLGYLVKQQERSDGGRYAESTWKTSDPTESPLTEKPLTEKPTPKKTITKEEQFKNNERTNSDFERFWEVYPKKTDKGAARRAFTRAVKKVDVELIIEKARAYAEDPNLPEKRFVKYPGSWLNAEAWDNGPLPERKESKPKADQKAIEEWLND